jgi:hypothetical protein
MLGGAVLGRPSAGPLRRTTLAITTVAAAATPNPIALSLALELRGRGETSPSAVEGGALIDGAPPCVPCGPASAAPPPTSALSPRPLGWVWCGQRGVAGVLHDAGACTGIGVPTGCAALSVVRCPEAGAAELDAVCERSRIETCAGVRIVRSSASDVKSRHSSLKSAGASGSSLSTSRARYRTFS